MPKANQVIKDADQMFQTVMKFYWAYLDELEGFIKQVPDDNQEIIASLHQQVEDIHEAIIHDMGIFEKAVEQDTEDLGKIQDQLKINNIYDQLNKK